MSDDPLHPDNVCWIVCEFKGSQWLELRDGEHITVRLMLRPHYCDRGHWQATVEDHTGTLDIDGQDGFPRYFMDEGRAKQEMYDWLVWRKKCRTHTIGRVPR